MLDVALPAQEDSPVLVRSFAACLASAAEVPVQALLGGDQHLEEAIARWRSWLAGRDAGLVPVANAGQFNWAGYWIAVLTLSPSSASPTTRDLAVLMFGTPAGVVLSPQDVDLVGRAARDLPVSKGYVLASLNPSLGHPDTRLPLRGTVEAIALAEVATGPVRLVDQALGLAGRGLEGDRYAVKAGTFTPSRPAAGGYDLTLIQSEVLNHLELPDGRRLSYADARRNIVTSGIDLNALVGRRFQIGDVECLGQRLCEPCAHLEHLTRKGVLRGLIHRGGLRADILTGGLIRVGAAIQTID